MTTDNICFHLQDRFIQTSQTGGQQYGDTSPFSIPCTNKKDPTAQGHEDKYSKTSFLV